MLFVTSRVAELRYQRFYLIYFTAFIKLWIFSPNTRKWPISTSNLEPYSPQAITFFWVLLTILRMSLKEHLLYRLCQLLRDCYTLQFCPYSLSADLIIRQGVAIHFSNRLDVLYRETYLKTPVIVHDMIILLNLTFQYILNGVVDLRSFRLTK